MSLDKRSLNRLRKRLPQGYLKVALGRLADQKRPLSDSYVSQVAKGARFDQGVIEVLITLAEEHQQRLAELKARAAGRQALTNA